ncbi:hypothetical protein Bbelb_081890 [Branchiostoma belcheri]|nr:hypothetical protein Bbelb_081890 [Branchiostoma belcheri]
MPFRHKRLAQHLKKDTWTPKKAVERVLHNILYRERPEKKRQRRSKGCQHSLKLFRCEPHVPSINVSCLVGSRGSQPANFRVGQWAWPGLAKVCGVASANSSEPNAQRRNSDLAFSEVTDGDYKDKEPQKHQC